MDLDSKFRIRIITPKSAYLDSKLSRSGNKHLNACTLKFTWFYFMLNASSTKIFATSSYLFIYTGSRHQHWYFKWETFLFIPYLDFTLNFRITLAHIPPKFSLNQILHFCFNFDVCSILLVSMRFLFWKFISNVSLVSIS